MSKGTHRVTANSKAGRRMTSGGGTFYQPRLQPTEIQSWNAAVEEKKRARATRRSVHHAKP